MSENEIDDSLLPNGDAPSDSSAEDEALWNAGIELADKGEPTGTFLCKIKEAVLGRSASSNRRQIHYTLEVISGDSVGVEIHKYDGLGSPKQVQITQGQLQKLGINAKAVGLEQLPGHLLMVHDRVVSVFAKKNGDFYNIFFNKLHEAGPDGKDAPF